MNVNRTCRAIYANERECVMPCEEIVQFIVKKNVTIKSRSTNVDQLRSQQMSTHAVVSQVTE